MVSDLLVGGSDVRLAARIAAHGLARGDRVTLLDRQAGGASRDLLRQAVESAAAATGTDAGAGRLRACRAEELPGSVPPGAAAWLVTGGAGPAPVLDARGDAELVRAALPALAEAGVREVVLVGAAEAAVPMPLPPLAGPAGALCVPPAAAAVADVVAAMERAAAEECARLGLALRVLRVACPVTADGRTPGTPAGLHRLLAAVEETVAEVRARAPGWFEREPLRLLAPPGAALPLLPAEDAARLLFALTTSAATAGRVCRVSSPHATPLAELCDRISDVYGIRLAAVSAPGELNVVDRLLGRRLTGVLEGAARPGAVLDASGVLGPEAEVTALRPPAQRALLRAVREGQRAAREERSRGRAAFVRALDTGTVPARDGKGTVVYHRAGPPPGDTGALPVVFVGALGQGPDFWYPLMRRLAARRRVLLVQPSGAAPGPAEASQTTALAGAPETAAVLEREGVGQAHLVGWCTGPKEAVALARAHPERVASLAFLSGSFRVAGREDGLDTEYERSLHTLCRTVHARPSAAGRLLRLFGQPESAPGSAENVLAATHLDLREPVRAPFRDEDALVRYAAAMLGFWDDDSADGAPEVSVPVLALGAEYDRVVSRVRLRAAAARFPRGRYAEFAAGTHQFLYDRAELLAEVLEGFWRDPADRTPPADEVVTGTAGEEPR
jgi:pimeloyl-ACP methyl ester carboxylesterase